MEEITTDLPEKLEVVDIQFRPGQKVYFFDPDGMQFVPGDNVIMDTARGPEFGICSGGNHTVRRKPSAQGSAQGHCPGHENRCRQPCPGEAGL